MKGTPPSDPFLLSTPERLLLAQQLLESVLVEAMPLHAHELAEVERRAAAVSCGELAVEEWPVLRAQLQARL